MQTLRRKPRSGQQKLAEKIALLKQKSFKQIGEVFEKFIPHALLKPERDGAMSRRRLFSKENTFWAFFSQVLDAIDFKAPYALEDGLRRTIKSMNA